MPASAPPPTLFRVKTIGARLTTLYVGSVALVLFGLLLLGHFLIQRHLVANVDEVLRARFDQLKERIGTEAVQGADLRGLLAATQTDSSLRVEVEDLWNLPAYREARRRGDPGLEDSALRFAERTGPDGAAWRVAEGDHESLRLRISAPLGPMHEALLAYLRIGASIALATLVLSAIAGRWLGYFALRPVRAIERTARRISRVNLSERIAVGTEEDEISRLARLLNETFDRLEAAFSEIRTFSADVSHEIKTPLSLVRLNIERLVLSESLSESSRTAMVDSIEEIDRLTRMVERLLFLARAEAGEVQLDRAAVDGRAFVEAFAHDAEALAEARGIRFTVTANEPGPVELDGARIRQVLLNLLSNALAATGAGGHLALSARWTPGAWRVALRDSGPGLSEDQCGAIFARFYRAPGAAAAGAGLGLAICKSIIDLHGGEIAARPNREGPGLTVEFALPVDRGTSVQG